MRKSKLDVLLNFVIAYRNECVGILLLLMTVSPVSGKYCTVLRSRKKTNTLIKKEPCIQSYQAACGWFSSNMCTYYERNMCEKQINQTKTFYSIVTECCPGYVMLPNETCLKLDPADYHKYNISNPGTSKTSLSDDDEGDDIEITHGVFAGIGCGALFIICVTILIVLHVRKNAKRKIIMNQGGVEMKEQKEKMIVTVPQDHPDEPVS